MTDCRTPPQGRSSSSSPTLALFGDSIANGLGVKDDKYGRKVADCLNHELIDFSATAMKVSESVELLSRFDGRIDIALVAHGVTEAILRPSPRVLRFVPKRWRRPGWLDPRPYYSSRLLRRSIQLAESNIRWRIKKFLMRFDEPFQFMDKDSYIESLQMMVDQLESRGARVIVLGPPDLDENYFPGSPYELSQYAKAAQSLNIEFVPIHGSLDIWGDYFADHFHPNDKGHSAISDVLLEYLATCGEMSRRGTS